MSSTERKYSELAPQWDAHEYADPEAYLRRRAEAVVTMGPTPPRGASILDLAAANGSVGRLLLARGYDYRCTDASPGMVEAARSLLGEGRAELGDLNTYVPPEPVDVTTWFRALYYADDTASLFMRAASFTRRKLVFDVDPRRFDISALEAQLETAGFDRVAKRPFFAPMKQRLPGSVLALLRTLEPFPPARVVLRWKFTFMVAAWRSDSPPA